MKKIKLKDQLNLLASYYNDPVAFGNDIIGDKYTDYQQEIMYAVADNPRVAWRSAHGLGKNPKKKAENPKYHTRHELNRMIKKSFYAMKSKRLKQIARRNAIDYIVMLKKYHKKNGRQISTELLAISLIKSKIFIYFECYCTKFEARLLKLFSFTADRVFSLLFSQRLKRPY